MGCLLHNQRSDSHTQKPGARLQGIAMAVSTRGGHVKRPVSDVGLKART